MARTQFPLWLENAARTALGKTLAGAPHENVETYAAPLGDDRVAERDRSQAGPLAQLFWAHQGRLAHKWPHYFPIYEQLFEKYRAGFTTPDGTTRPLKFLEIGVSHGGSLQLWRKYFGPDAVIYGIDIDPRCAAVDDKDLQVRIGSQVDPGFLHDVIDEMGGVDIVLDDGSHIAEHQRASFDTLLPMMSEGGLYVVEDVQTAYWRPWQGGYRRPGTFIEIAKSVVDDMYARYHLAGAKRPGADDQIFSTTFYDGIVVFAKSTRPPSTHVQIGTKSF